MLSLCLSRPCSALLCSVPIRKPSFIHASPMPSPTHSFDSVLASLCGDASTSEDADASIPYTFQLDATESGVKKPIVLHLWRPEGFDSFNPEHSVRLIIATHGAGGTSLSPASAQFCAGLVTSSDSDGTSSHAETTASSSPPLLVLAFDGVSHLASRVKAFIAVIEYVSVSKRLQDRSIALAGRSMGCRAAAIALAQAYEANAKLSKHLLLSSYPLLGKNEDVRRQVLLDLPEEAAVLFVSGSRDDMCPISALEGLVGDMAFAANQRDLLVLDGLDHGLQAATGISAPGVTKKDLADKVGRRAAGMARDWLAASLASGPPKVNAKRSLSTRADLVWDDDRGDVACTSWRTTCSHGAGKQEDAQPPSARLHALPPESSESETEGLRRSKRQRLA